jgi:hypothetical protein
MKTASDLETYLISSELPHERIGDNMWVVSVDSGSMSHVVLWIDSDVVGFRLKVTDLGDKAPGPLMRKLLELNASELVHCAYGIEEDAIVLVASQLLSTFDLEEFQAILDSFGIAVSTHHSILSALL